MTVQPCLNYQWMHHELEASNFPDMEKSYLKWFISNVTIRSTQVLRRVNLNNVVPPQYLLKLSRGVYCITMPDMNPISGATKTYLNAVIINLRTKKMELSGFLFSNITRVAALNDALRENGYWTELKEEWDHFIKTHAIVQVNDLNIMVQERFEGDLGRYLKGNECRTIELLKMCSQLAQQVMYLHQHNIAHRDIKIENVLINREGKVALVDFGDTQKIDNPIILGGTICMWAPEFWLYLCNCVSAETLDVRKMDIWSLGLTFGDILYPYQQIAWSNERKSIHKLQRSIVGRFMIKMPLCRTKVEPLLLEMRKGFELIPNEPASEFIAEMVAFESDKRPSIEHIATRCQDFIATEEALQYLVVRK